MTCYICGDQDATVTDWSPIPGHNNPPHGFDRVACPRCGQFDFSRDILAKIRERKDEKLSKSESAILSHALHRMQEGTQWPQFTASLFEEILNTGKVPTPREQAENFILWMGNKLDDDYFLTIDVDYKLYAGIMGAVSTSIGPKEVLNYLKEKGYIKIEGPPIGTQAIRMTTDGWEFYEVVRRGSKQSRLAFMAMPFGNDILDKVFRDFFVPAVREIGFDLRRLDDDPAAGLIDDRLRVRIRRAKFLIAEMTYGNHGAYWEAGFAEGLGIPVIYSCERTYFDDKDIKEPHFDTNHHETVIWQDSDQELKLACKKLKATIQATFPSEAILPDD